LRVIAIAFTNNLFYVVGFYIKILLISL
jgi:hypothetical protein